MNPGYTAEEKLWLKKHWKSEYYLLRDHGLCIYKDEDREEGRAIVQALMRDEASGYTAPQTTDQADKVFWPLRKVTTGREISD